MEMFAALPANIALGISVAFSPLNLFFCFLGVFLGTVVGVLPGIGALAAVSMLIPLTFHLDPTPAIIMLAGIWYGSSYGGSTASILLNLPGTPQAVITAIDGYQMTRQGRAGLALSMTAVASFVGGSIGILLLMLFSPVIVHYAIQFGPAEFFALMVLGLVAASTITVGSPTKSFAMIALGLLISTVGSDLNTGVGRFTFGMHGLYDGISLVALAMGLFGISEVLASLGQQHPAGATGKVTLRSMIPTRREAARSVPAMLRGTGIGAFMGALPGTGPALATFMAYGIEKRFSKHAHELGTGAIEGITSPEAANNASDQTAFIPTLTLGIPGSATMALLLAVLLIHGVTPGPRLMGDHPDIFWGIIMSFWIGNVFLLILNLPLIGLWVRMLSIRWDYLLPAILFFISVGVYSVHNSTFDIWIALLFGAGGFLMRLADLPTPQLMLGFVLGPLMEENFRRATLMSYGELSFLYDRPLTATIMALALALVLYGVVAAIRSRRRADVKPTPSTQP